MLTGSHYVRLRKFELNFFLYGIHFYSLECVKTHLTDINIFRQFIALRDNDCIFVCFCVKSTI